MGNICVCDRSVAGEQMGGSEAQEAVQRFQERKKELSADPMRGADHGIEFYEADHVLSQDDRTKIAEDLAAVAIPGVQNGILSSCIAIAFPTIRENMREYMKNKQTPPTPGTTPRRLPMFRYPFLSLGLGMFSFQAFLLGTFYWKTHQKKKELSQNIEEGKDVETNRRLLSIWNIIPFSNVLFWLRYYSLSADDPSFIMKDPRKVTKEDIHEVHYSPKLLGSQFVGKNEPEPSLPHWQQIRQEHGFVPEADHLKNNKDSELQSQSQPNFDTDFQGEEELQQEDLLKPQSKWDQIRRLLSS